MDKVTHFHLLRSVTQTSTTFSRCRILAATSKCLVIVIGNSIGAAILLELEKVSFILQICKISQKYNSIFGLSKIAAPIEFPIKITQR